MEALLYPLILGLGRIETTEPLRYNGVFHYLAGLPGYPAATSVRRFLERLAEAGREALLKLHDIWRVAMVGQSTRAIFDLDTTVLTVYGASGTSRGGLQPEEARAPVFLPLLCFEGNTQDCWEGGYHPGDTHVSTITIPLLERAFAKLPEAIREVRVRADGAFFDRSEGVTIPLLPDIAEWEAYEAARQNMIPKLSLSSPAVRYGVSALTPSGGKQNVRRN